MDKKYELLKVKYENTRTWLMTLFVVMLTMSIAYNSVEDIAVKKMLSNVTPIVLIAVLILVGMQFVRYARVLSYLKK